MTVADIQLWYGFRVSRNRYLRCVRITVYTSGLLKKMGVVAVVGIIVLTVAVGFAVARTNYGHHLGCHGPLGFIGRQLDISDAQKQQIKSIWRTESPTIAALVHELADEQKQMNSAGAEGKDPSKIQTIANSQALTVVRLIVEKEKLVAEIYTTVLTPEQKAKADQWRQQWPTRLDKIADRIAHGADEAAQ